MKKYNRVAISFYVTMETDWGDYSGSLLSVCMACLGCWWVISV